MLISQHKYDPLFISQLNQFSNYEDELMLYVSTDFFTNNINLNKFDADINFKSNLTLSYKQFTMHKSSFTHFFITNLIDVPLCFKSIPSLKRLNREIYVLKFINYITKNGLKIKYHNIFFNAVHLFLDSNKSNQTRYNLISLYTLLNNFFLHKNVIYNLAYQNNDEELQAIYLEMFASLEMSTPFTRLSTNLFKNLNQKIDDIAKKQSTTNTDEDVIEDETPISNKPIFFPLLGQSHYDGTYKYIYENDSIKQQLIKLFSNITLIFNFFIYNVPKNIKKFSRNKSGKFLVVWKYIPFYKRILITMKIISKYIKFVDKLKYQDKIIYTLNQLNGHLKNNFIWQQKIFTYNHVFKNYKQSLMKSLQIIR